MDQDVKKKQRNMGHSLLQSRARLTKLGPWWLENCYPEYQMPPAYLHTVQYIVALSRK